MLKYPSKEEQIHALLRRTAYKLLERYPGADYQDIFTIKKREIFDHVKNNCKLQDLVFVKFGTNDGFYVIKEGEQKYLVFEQENLVRSGESVVRSVDEALSKFVDYLLSGSGTGLNFD